MAFQILFAACLVGGFLFPWWWPALAGFAIGAWLPRNSAAAATSGFFGAGAAWAAAAGWRDLRNHHILSGRIADLFHLPGSAGAIAVSALVGGLMGALGAWAGYAMREWVRPRIQPLDPPPLAEARNAAALTAGSESSDGTFPARAAGTAGTPAPAPLPGPAASPSPMGSAPAGSPPPAPAEGEPGPAGP
jgi:hypothetical protein